MICIYSIYLADSTPSEGRSVSGSSTPKTLAAAKTPGTGKKRGRPSKAVMREREEAKRARGEVVEPKPKDKVPKKRGRKPKIDWASMSEEVSCEHRFTHCIYFYESRYRLGTNIFLFINIAKGNIEAREKSGAKRKASSENERTSTTEKR